MNEDFEVPADLDETLESGITEILPSPDEIVAQQVALKESAMAKLTTLGLTLEEAKAVVGIG
jgi:hypothetical protein